MNNPHKKYKRPKQRTLSTTKPQSSKQRHHESRAESPESLCPLAAKDSEWVDILQTSNSEPEQSSSNLNDEEEILQLVECEEGPEMKPLAVMFPGLLDKDPRTLQGMLNKAMSTTEVTKHLVDLGQKANFTFMKQADRLIPKDKRWLESLTENSNSFSSMVSGFYSGKRRKEAAAGKSNSDELTMCMKQIIIEIIQLCGNDVCVNDDKISDDTTATSDFKKTEE